MTKPSGRAMRSGSRPWGARAGAAIAALAALALAAPLAAQQDGERPAPPAGDTLSGRIPEPDELYGVLAAGQDTAAAPGADAGPVEYRGQRLIFYPQSEVIVLEGQAAAEQAGTELGAGRILFRNREGVVEAFGDASVSRGPSQLQSDSLFYDRESGVVATFGTSILTENQSQTEGFDLLYDLDRQSGTLGGGTTTYAPWILEGAEMSKIGEGTFLVDDGYFTTCELEDPHYTFRSDNIKLRQNDVIVASPVVLYFSDIPVFYLPWYVEPVTRGRHSGFLRPKIGLNTLLFDAGRERSVQDLGYYYVFNEYADALVAADWYTESRFIMRFDARYNLRYAFQGDFHIESVWNRLEDSRSQLIRYRHDHTLSRDTRGNVDVNWSNSRSFLRRNSFDPEEILQRSFRSAASYSTRFDWGSLVAGADADFRLDVSRTDFRLPDVRLSINQRPLWGRSGAGVAGERPWYQELQYSASTSFTARLTRSAVDSLGNPLNSLPTDSLGNPIDTARETVVNEQESLGRFTLSGPLTLFGVIKTTPSVNYNASFVNDELAEGGKFGGRGQMGGGLSMSSRFFRVFDPPLGPFTRARHVVNPSVNFSYSPRANLFGAESTDGARERLQESLTASISLGQDIDVKMPLADDAPMDSLAPGDSAAADSVAAEEQTRTLSLLNVTNTLSYDFIRAREEGQLGLSDLSTRLTTGLGEDFNVSTSFSHELVRQETDDVTGDTREVFAPFLSRITTDFSIRKGGMISVSRRRAGDDRNESVQAGRGSDETAREAQENLAANVGPEAAEGSGFGPWSVNLTHSWTRVREGEGGRQSVGIGASMLPSPNWSLDYRTTYDVTDGELQAQSLALVRNLHDWQASLGFNLFPADPQDRVLITFSVYLRDAPELEIPYRVRRE